MEFTTHHNQTHSILNKNKTNDISNSTFYVYINDFLT